MAVTMVLHDAQVDTVLESTKSINTCSASTLRLLRALLGFEDTTYDSGGVRDTLRASKQKRTTTAATKTRNNAKITILDCAEPPIQCLPRNKRLALATNTFNKTLKNLGDAVKAKVAESGKRSGGMRSPLKETQSRIGATSRKLSKPAASLHPPQSQSPEVQRNRATLTLLSAACSRLFATAECARTSLQCLRQLQAEGSATQDQDAQLEQGALVLISKLHGLGLIASAVEEVLSVRKSLDHILQRQRHASTSRARLDIYPLSGSLVDCIEFADFGDDTKTIGLITAFQTQVLQLVAANEKPSIDENLLQRLDPANPKSPFHMVLLSVEQGWLSAEKAALQLHSLSQSVLSICSVSSKIASKKSSCYISPNAQFQLRCIALRMRCRWWRLSHHQFDIDKEIWAPFLSFMASLREADTQTTTSQFLLVKRSLDQLLEQLPVPGDAPTFIHPTRQPSAKVISALQNMAEAAGSSKDSLDLLQGLKGLCGDLSGLQGAVYHCKLANAILLERSSAIENLIPAVETALSDLDKPLRGTTTDLERLLLQASGLRKAAAMRLAANSEELRTVESPNRCQINILGVCMRITFGVLRFVVRYISLKPRDQAYATCIPKTSQTGRCSTLVAQQSVKSALAAVQANITREYVGWKLCASALADCLSVSQILCEMRQNVTNADAENGNMPTTSVRISNIFWSRYLNQKEAHASVSELVSTVEESIQALEGRTLDETKAGLLAIKCEKAATLYTEIKQFNSARNVLSIAINTHIQSGVLSAVSRKALTHSTQQIWAEADSPEFALGRVLSAYARLLLKHRPNPSTSAFFDKADLQVDERLLLLEKQFVAFREISAPESLHAPLKEAAEMVLSLYSESTIPTRHLRFISELLTFCSTNRLSPHHFLPEKALQVCTEDTFEESVLIRESPLHSDRCLRSSVLLQWAFQTDRPSANLLRNFAEAHTIAIDSTDSWSSLLGFINDPALVLSQVQSAIDFADMQGLSQIKLDALLLMRRLLEIDPAKDISAMASCTTQIGLQYTRMGLTTQAGRALANAEHLVTGSKSKTLIALQWHLAYVEYFIALCSYEKAADHLISAQWRYDVDFVSHQETGFRGPRLAEHRYLAQAAWVASMLAFENGDLESALLHAKRGVRVSIRQWTVLERLLAVKASSITAGQSDAKMDGLVDDLSQMTLSTVQRPKNQSVKAAPFWAHVQLHFDGLIHLSRLSAHSGSFQDAIYYAEQAKKIGEATGSDVLLCKASSICAAHLAQCCRFDDSQRVAVSFFKRCDNIEHFAASPRVFLDMASAHLASGQYAQGIEAVEKAQRAIDNIQAADCSSSPSGSERKTSTETIPTKKASQSVGRNASKSRKARHPATKAANFEVLDGVEGLTSNKLLEETSVSSWIQRLQAEARILKSCLCIKSGSSEDAGDLLGQVAPLLRDSTSDGWYWVMKSTLMLADALRLLQSDAVYSVLAESSIAHPTRLAKHADDSQIDRPRNPTRSSVDKPTCSGNKVTKKKKCNQPGLLQPRELITKAREMLLLCSSSLSEVSSLVVEELSSLLAGLLLLSSVVLPASSPGPSPIQIVCHLNAPKSLHWTREIASVRADIVLGEKTNVIAWPEAHELGQDASRCSSPTLDSTLLQQKLNDNLPPSWNVVTVALSQDDSEFVISKIRKGQAPYVLRLPLERTTSDDLDEEPFSFHTAKNELQDIITNANLTAHDAKARSDKKGKKQWWATREALDNRLASLLNNMETLWLGGFRGIFSDQNYDEELLARFSDSIARALDQHLPSRRKTGANTESRFQFHSHVLELFIALGNPDENELDDAITDLLYFVIDILQFQGERNAYDEVDFDAIVVEVTDALRSYHEAIEDVSERGGHTILILDKALHAFPWESLPCLGGKSVTRMPSLSCLQDRLLRMEENGVTSPGLRIDPQRGAYILNPSSDLAATQETFLDPFSSAFTDYISIVNRAPSETEFAACLRDKDLCLYFGHGSGAQFIRGRTIKRLNRCAVTFLMGCSSSKMVECGQFEPYGVPYNYLYAGSGAVVGTLWDVTDKDIDRFAMETFMSWGLLDRDVGEEDGENMTGKLKGRGRGKKHDKDINKTPLKQRPQEDVGLDDAVAKARDACLLRYLNGAAPVIYGIPVYLDR